MNKIIEYDMNLDFQILTVTSGAITFFAKFLEKKTLQYELGFNLMYHVRALFLVIWPEKL